MLFCSYEFILVFLPLVLIVVLGASALGRRDLAKVFLFVASLIYYAWWNPKYLTLLLALLAFNYAIGTSLIRSKGGNVSVRRRRTVLWVGVLANILALLYYKYANFFVEVIAGASGHEFNLRHIVLPLGISFIVFQKIAFLVDAYGGQIETFYPLDYGLFVSFFPQLIAGPIVHHREVMPQFKSPSSLRFSFPLMALALSFFVLGLAKKILLADSLSDFASSGFRQNATPLGLDTATAWLSVLAYTLQVYFDFSGYSDMAIGLGLMFGVRLPFNFNSPLKARSMIEFWSRWHMTLTRFLTAYVYNPLVLRATRKRLAARKKTTLRGRNAFAPFLWLLALPTMLTMFIAGAWHGAGFQFIAFGLIHGAYLVINHAWRTFRKPHPAGPAGAPWQRVLGARSLTLFALLVSMPFFRAPSARSALHFVRAMFGSNGFFHPAATAGVGALANLGHLSPRVALSLLDENKIAYLLPLLFLASQLLPNTQQILREPLEAAAGPLAKHAGEGSTMDLAKASSWSWPKIVWRPNLAWAIGLALVGWYAVTHLVAPTEFLYFQF